jgi:hypothetical protein
MSEDVTLFTDVDRTGDPDFFIRFLDQGNANPDIQKSKPYYPRCSAIAAGIACVGPGMWPRGRMFSTSLGASRPLVPSLAST